MITLRDLVKIDPAISTISGDECHLISELILFVHDLSLRWYLSWCLPPRIKEQLFNLRMLGAVLGRTETEREPNLQEAIKLAMETGRKESK